MRLFSGQRAWVLQRITALILIAGVISGSALLLLQDRSATHSGRASSPAGTGRR